MSKNMNTSKEHQNLPNKRKMSKIYHQKWKQFDLTKQTEIKNQMNPLQIKTEYTFFNLMTHMLLFW